MIKRKSLVKQFSGLGRRLKSFVGREKTKTLMVHGYKKKIEKVMDSYDKIFKTLVAPVSFIILLTWTFFFFTGSILAGQDLELLEAQISAFYIPHIAFHMSIFVLSVFIWSLSVFARVGEKEIRFRKWKTGYQSVARFLKRISLGSLFSALLIAPAQIIVMALRPTLGTKLASDIYISFLLVAILLLIILLPLVNERRMRRVMTKKSKIQSYT